MIHVTVSRALRFLFAYILGGVIPANKKNSNLFDALYIIIHINEKEQRP